MRGARIFLAVTLFAGCSSTPPTDPRQPVFQPAAVTPPSVNSNDPAAILAVSMAQMRRCPARLTEESTVAGQAPVIGIFAQDGQGRIRWEGTTKANGRSVKNLCIHDGSRLWVYLLDHHGREFVSSATSDEVARANARRPGGPPAGGYGEMAPAAELEFWSSAFRVDQVSTEEVAGERCYILSGAGPARLEEPAGDPRAQATTAVNGRPHRRRATRASARSINACTATCTFRSTTSCARGSVA